MHSSMLTTVALFAGLAAMSSLAAPTSAFAQTARGCTYMSPFPANSGTPFTDGAFKNALYCFIVGDAERTAERSQAGAINFETPPAAFASHAHRSPAYRYSGQHAGGPANDLISR
jgi:hypothetical protein